MSRFLNATLGAAAALVLAVSPTLMAADAHAHTHDHGAMTAVGTVTLGTIVAKVASEGSPTAGKDWHVVVGLPAGTAVPKALRIWIGIENGRGSEKAKAEAQGGHPGSYAAHVDVPVPLPDGSRLWVALENAAGETSKGSIALPGVASTVAPHAGHDHQDHSHSDHDHK